MSCRPGSFALATLALLTVLAPLPAQSGELQREISFVRALAEKLRFISLAQSEVDRLANEYEKSSDFKAISQLGIEISLIGAKLHPNREKKRTLFKDALDRSEDFIARYEGDPVVTAARITLADAAIQYGKYLADEIELARIEAPGKVQGLEEEAATVFRNGVDACDKAMDDLRAKKDTDDKASIDYHVTWLRKGILLREHARAVRKDREYLLDRARDNLEELILEVGEETALGLKGLFELAQCDEVAGDLEEANRSYDDVIDAAYISLTSPELGLSGDVRELMVILMEEAYDRKGTCLFELGRTDDVLQLVESYRKRLEELGVEVTKFEEGEVTDGKEDPRYGHSLYVTEARAMAESGKPDLVARALEQARYYNEKHPNDIVGLKAKAVIKDILDAQASMVSGTLLLEVAKGDYQAKSYELAIKGCKKALAAMSADELAKHGLEAYYMMGWSHIQQDRALEATLALKTGLERYGNTAEDKLIAEKATDLVQRTMRQVKHFSKSDPFFDDLGNQVIDLAARFGSTASASKRYWQQAGTLMTEDEFEEAIETYRKITPDSVYYEWAFARMAAAYQRMDRHDAAREVIQEYRDYLQTKDARIPSDRNDLRQARAIAQAETDFYEGYVTYLDAMGDGKQKKRLPLFPKAIEYLADFEDRHGKVTPKLVPRVRYVLGRSYVEIGELDKAEEAYRILQKDFPRNPTVAVLASAIFGAYYDQVTAQMQVVESEEVRADADKLQAEQRKLEALRRRLLAFGLDYLETSGNPQYEISYITLEQAEALGDWSLVESLGNRIIKTFGGQKEFAERVERFVKRIVGTALLRQHKYRQAYDLLSAAEKADPDNYPLKRLVALALGGWQEVDELGRVQRFYGLNRPAEAYEKLWTEYRPYALSSRRGVDPYSLEWYRFHWEVYHNALKAAEKDTDFVRRAQAVYNIARATDNFATLQEMGKTEPEARELFQLFFQNEPPR